LNAFIQQPRAVLAKTEKPLAEEICSISASSQLLIEQKSFTNKPARGFCLQHLR
jgi:hypothetical protein